MSAVVSPEVLRELLCYAPESGVLTWQQRPIACFANARCGTTWNTRYAGKEAFSATGADGYRCGGVHKKPLLAHRVIWAMVHGRWPDGQIDHIDGNRQNNRLSNLREVPLADNARNAKVRRDNRSGIPGVLWHPRDKKWTVRIGGGDNRRSLGYFATLEGAIAARRAAEARLGYHANHGR